MYHYKVIKFTGNTEEVQALCPEAMYNSKGGINLDIPAENGIKTCNINDWIVKNEQDGTYSVVADGNFLIWCREFGQKDAEAVYTRGKGYLTLLPLRSEIYETINSEREYQEAMKQREDSHIVEDFPLSAGLEAIRYNLNKANTAWYNEKAPYPNAMEFLRKVAAVCVQMGEKYGMNPREEGGTQ